jgi:hypothetical protein
MDTFEGRQRTLLLNQSNTGEELACNARRKVSIRKGLRYERGEFDSEVNLFHGASPFRICDDNLSIPMTSTGLYIPSKL